MPTPARYSYFGLPARSGPPLYDHWPKDDGEWVRYEDYAAVVAELREALQALIAQHGCDCKHRACKRCRETGEVNELLDK